jgi:predicted nucleotidyltransferase component of viral defense system
MITADQISKLAKQLKTNETVVAREYFQLWFLQLLYQQNYGRHIFFKGGTALRLVFAGSRFSEDLDFTVQMTEKSFLQSIEELFNTAEKLGSVDIKPKKTITGQQFLMTAHLEFLPYPIHIRFDFSFRESVLQPETSTIITDFPVIFHSYIHHLGLEEIMSEKVRAIMTRQKGRDLYDLWFLLAKGVKLNPKYIQAKLDYYGESYDPERFIKIVQSFPQDQFVLDLRPFVPIGEREKLPELLPYIQNLITTQV